MSAKQYAQLAENPKKFLDSLTADEIAQLLEEASAAYYNSSKQLMSDDLFDVVKAHLKKIAPKHDFFKKVGAPVEKDKVTLPYWMGSLDKIRDDAKALTKWKEKYPGEVIISDKLDGNSAMIVFDVATGFRMYSRGDGEIGQNITSLLSMMPSMKEPMEFIKTSGLKKIAIRGELIISRKNWETISHMGANARNVVAGTMNAKTRDARITQWIEFVAYDLLEPKSPLPSTGLQAIQDLGFTVMHHEMVKGDQMTPEFLSEILMRRRKNSPYEIDGIVVMHNEQHKLVKGKNPKYGFAFKSILTHAEAEVIVSDVEWNASKDGYLKPLVHFPTVTIAGVNISKATGFNAQFIEKNVIGPGSRLVIIRSGDVIPHILRVLSPSATGQPQFPTDTEYIWNDTHVDILVAGESKEVALKTLEHFAKTLQIPFVAAGTIKRLFDQGINTIPKLYALTENDLKKLDGFKGVMAEKIAKSLQEMRDKVTCEQLMVASNLFGRGLGEKKLTLIVQHFPDILKASRKMPSKSELLQVEGIGGVTADAFLKTLSKFYQLLDDLSFKCEKQKPPTPKATPANVAGVRFDEETIVFTGFRSKEWEELVTSRGGKISGSVSKKTTLVVAADPNENSGKLEKARELGIKIVSKEQFATMVNA